MHRPAQRDDTQVQDGMKSGFVCMLYAGFAGVEHTQGMALNWVDGWLVLAALLTLESPTPAVRAWGIEGELKAEGIRRRVTLLASLFL